MTMNDQHFEENIGVSAYPEGALSDDGRSYEGKAQFFYRNGDTYKGSFKAFSDGNIYRQGDGVYTTKDSEVYEGSWEQDFLKEHVTIRFPDGCEYAGTLSPPPQLTYSGFASYTFHDGATMFCTFDSNYPDGPVWVNSQGHVWAGPAERSCAYLVQLNRFMPPDPEFDPPPLEE